MYLYADTTDGDTIKSGWDRKGFKFMGNHGDGICRDQCTLQLCVVSVLISELFNAWNTCSCFCLKRTATWLPRAKHLCGAEAAGAGRIFDQHRREGGALGETGGHNHNPTAESIPNMHQLLPEWTDEDPICEDTVDGCEILHQLIVVYPMICRVSTIKGGAGFLLSTVSQSPKAPLGCGALRSTSDQIWVNFLEFLRLLRCVWDCWD